MLSLKSCLQGLSLIRSQSNGLKHSYLAYLNHAPRVSFGVKSGKKCAAWVQQQGQPTSGRQLYDCVYHKQAIAHLISLSFPKQRRSTLAKFRLVVQLCYRSASLLMAVKYLLRLADGIETVGIPTQKRLTVRVSYSGFVRWLCDFALQAKETSAIASWSIDRVLTVREDFRNV